MDTLTTSIGVVKIVNELEDFNYVLFMQLISIRTPLSNVDFLSVQVEVVEHLVRDNFVQVNVSMTIIISVN